MRSAFSRSSNACTAPTSIPGRESAWPSCARGWSAWAGAAAWSRSRAAAAGSGSNCRVETRPVANHNAVLLAEDNPDDVFLVKRAFRKSFGDVGLHVVPDGEAAIAYLRREPPYDDAAKCPVPSLLLLDLKLPRLSGFEVLAWLREQHVLKRLPVVVLTSSRDRGDVDRAYDLGANSYLVKPVS